MQKNLKLDDGKDRILRVINKVTKGLDVEAICMYGSRVSGYAKEESDYDLILSLIHISEPTRPY